MNFNWIAWNIIFQVNLKKNQMEYELKKDIFLKFHLINICKSSYNV